MNSYNGRFRASFIKQGGITTIGLLVTIASIAFLVIAFQWRISSISIGPLAEQVFRGAMLIYFNLMLYLIAPRLARWLNRQEFMIQENKTTNNSIWVQRILLAISVVMVIALAEAVISGVMQEIKRYGSGPEVRALAQPAEFWSNVFAGYMITLFPLTVYWQMRQWREDN